MTRVPAPGAAGASSPLTLIGDAAFACEGDACVLPVADAGSGT